MTTPQKKSNPLHGVTLEMIVTQLVEHFGWKKLGEKIPINCFTKDPSISSSLKLLRRTPWARQKVETLYIRSRFALKKKKRVDRPLAQRPSTPDTTAAGGNADADNGRKNDKTSTHPGK